MAPMRHAQSDLALAAGLAATLAFGGLGAPLACAQPAAEDAPASSRTGGAPKEHEGARPPRPDHGRDVGFLLGALKAAPDEASAKAIANRILTLWLASGSDTADLLMGRAKTAADAKDLDLALQLLDAVVDLKPDYAEGWNRRATIHFLKKDIGRSLADLRQALAHEPRHFGAWAGLGMILHDIGEDKPALEALRRALAINPHLQRVPELVKTLAEKLEGRDI